MILWLITVTIVTTAMARRSLTVTVDVAIVEFGVLTMRVSLCVTLAQTTVAFLISLNHAG